MIIVDVLYGNESDISDPEVLLKKHAATSGHYKYLAEQTEVHVIKHLNYTGEEVHGNVSYYFRKGSFSSFWIPWRLHRFMHKKMQPDIIITHSFYYPLQLLLLKLQTRSKIILQYHGGADIKGIKKVFHQLIEPLISGYIFTSSKQAGAYIKQGLISSHKKVFEVMEGSTSFTKKSKTASRNELTIPLDKIVFLWVGRLDENKDPLTVLKGFEEILRDLPQALLYMIYSDDKLLSQVQLQIAQSNLLKEHVKLVGQLPNESLETFYNAADFFVLGSYCESGGYALCEAMACGCIPVVTNIPSFLKMTSNGTIGALWKPRDKQSFVDAVRMVLKKDLINESEMCVRFFEEKLSFKAIAKKQFEIAHQLIKSNH